MTRLSQHRQVLRAQDFATDTTFRQFAVGDMLTFTAVEAGGNVNLEGHVLIYPTG